MLTHAQSSQDGTLFQHATRRNVNFTFSVVEQVGGNQKQSKKAVYFEPLSFIHSFIPTDTVYIDQRQRLILRCCPSARC